MTRILAIQHIECETLGAFAELAPKETEFVYSKPFLGETPPDFRDGFDGLIVLGGPMAVYESRHHAFLDDEIGLIRSAIESDFPTLGICLGSQLIAAAAGANVYPGPKKETGWGTVTLTEAASGDALFAGLSSPMPVFQLHGDTFDLPPKAVRLAGNELYPNQAFRLGNNIYGLQFHVEVNGSLVREWAAFYRDYLESAGASEAEILKDLDSKCAELQPAAAQIVEKITKIA